MRRMRHLKPREIQGCSLSLNGALPETMFDATSGGSTPSVGSDVARWEDVSGSGNHVTQSTSGNRPARASNGITFTKANADRLINSTASVSYPATVICAFGAISTLSVWLDGYADASRHAHARGGTGDNPNTFVLTVANGGSFVSGTTPDNANANVVTCIDGQGIIRHRAFGSISSGTGGFNGFSVGNLRGNPSPIGSLGSTYGFGGTMHEIAVWSGALSRHVAQRMSDGLQRKWRIYTQ
jgi:hypothetical protein